MSSSNSQNSKTMNESEKKNLFQKMIEVKRKVAYLQKDAKGYGYDYTSGSLVLSKINEVLNNEGVFVFPRIKEKGYQPITVQTKNGPRDEMLYDLDLIYTFVNIDNPNETLEVPWSGIGINGEEKGFGSALTYGERYFFLKFFQIPTDKDDPDAFEKKIHETGNGADKKKGSKPKQTIQPKSGPTRTKQATTKKEFNQGPESNIVNMPGADTEAFKKLATDYDKLIEHNKPIFSEQEVEKFTRKDQWNFENIVGAQKYVKELVEKRSRELDLEATNGGK